jgi:TonB family protein
MRISLGILFLSGSYIATAQETVKEKHDVKGNWGYKPDKEEYYVLKDDRSVKHGPYKLTDNKGNMLTQGYYNMGKRDSSWVEYDRWYRFVAVESYYKNEKRVGTWTFRKNADTVEMKYDFDNNKLIYYKVPSDKKYAVISGTDTLNTTLDQPPVYLSGQSAILKTIVENINYPNDAKEKGIQGTVLVAFTVSPDGRASAPWLYKGVKPIIDNEALRVAALIQPDWAAGVKDGQPVTSVYVQPIGFRLE